MKSIWKLIVGFLVTTSIILFSASMAGNSIFLLLLLMLPLYWAAGTGTVAILARHKEVVDDSDTVVG